MENERFVTYYKAQKIVPEEEWEAFMASLRQHLPTTFRVAGTRQTAATLNYTIKTAYVTSLSNVEFEGQQIPPLYPDGLAWQFNVPKKALRKSPEFKKFHSFLVFETEVGNISRQEAVSMLPPLFLDVEPHHKVMDMCAAPGSKTAQLLEALHANDTPTSTSTPSGLLIANDSDHKRTHLLIHQSARLPSPALMVTNLDASIYPGLKVPASINGGNDQRLESLLFDRILCDVPCSGDGTIRKNMGIWKKWQAMDGNGLHGLQLRILQRAMKLLKKEGRIVYSTCSLNPVENEAVVAAALRLNPDFKLIDVASKLPELIRRPGLTEWRPAADRTAEETFNTHEAYINSPVDKSRSKLTEGHWPPVDVERYNLPLCMRIYPHLQDSGGFFVAVLERTTDTVVHTTPNDKKREAEEAAEISETKKPRLANDPLSGDAIPEAAPSTGTDSPDPTLKPQENSSSKRGKQKQNDAAESVGGGVGGQFKENPYTFLTPDDPDLLSCIERLHLTSEFPSSNVLVRNPTGDAIRSLYITNEAVKQVVLNNDFNRIRLTAAGTKVCSKQDAGKGTEPQFRVLGEGLPVILPYIDPATIILGDMTTLKTLIESYYPLCSTFIAPFRDIVEALEPGSHVVRFPPGELDGASLTHEIVLPIWKSNVSLTLMIDKKAKRSVPLAGETAPPEEGKVQGADPIPVEDDIMDEGAMKA
ncbi:S-adenosyl-L-methionine-dependent methyltransferase [Infundibulicybe gibba]|nr:S-adenosyl-L-methionine-dependent methyltransferase [Infundibulicybe gibba]